MAGRKVKSLYKVSKISLARPSTKTDYLAEVVHGKNLED